MVDPRWRKVPDLSLATDDVIMTSLLVLKIINMLMNLTIFSDT